jgi:hypothetical protein
MKLNKSKEWYERSAALEGDSEVGAGSLRRMVGGRYESWAEWPPIHPAAPNEQSADTHDTQEKAEAVCKMLERDGLGGERKVFPIRTWVKPSNKDSAT